MKIIVTGSLGHISRPLATALVGKGHAVTVISSQPGKKQEIEALGAAAAIGSVEDADFLTSTFRGADAVYSMVPPKGFFDPNVDLAAFYNRIANNYATAVEQSGVKRLVHLSSIGAHLEKDSGLILLHHDAERTLDRLSGVAITFMRPVAFYYNLYGFMQGIKTTGMIASNYGGEDRVAWVSRQISRLRLPKKWQHRRWKGRCAMWQAMNPPAMKSQVFWARPSEGRI
jgi:uncharacterized protein YbjT (DUF2867 family)